MLVRLSFPLYLMFGRGPSCCLQQLLEAKNPMEKIALNTHLSFITQRKLVDPTNTRRMHLPLRCSIVQSKATNGFPSGKKSPLDLDHTPK